MFEPTFEKGPNFDRARSMIATPFEYVDIDMSAAGSNQIFNVSGDFLFVDGSSTGVATLEVNNQYNDPAAPFQVQAGFGLQCLFKQIKLSWAAQDGKKLRILYSTGARVVPTNVMQVSINSAPRSTFVNAQKTVTNASAQLLAGNTNRAYLLIQNNDAAGIVYIGFGAAAVTAANGIKLAPGASYELNSNITTSEIKAIGSIASNANVITVEG
jgi:hypothetical protein